MSSILQGTAPSIEHRLQLPQSLLQEQRGLCLYIRVGLREYDT